MLKIGISLKTIAYVVFVVGAVLFLALPESTIVAYQELVRAMGPMYFVIEGVQLIRVALAVSQFLSNKAGSDDNPQLAKGIIIGFSAVCYVFALKWLLACFDTDEHSRYSGAALFFCALCLIGAVTAASIIVPVGVLTDGALVSALVAYAFGPCAHLRTDTVGVLFFSLLFLLCVGTLALEAFTSAFDKETIEQTGAGYLFEADPLARTLTVLAATHMVSSLVSPVQALVSQQDSVPLVSLPSRALPLSVMSARAFTLARVMESLVACAFYLYSLWQANEARGGA